MTQILGWSEKEFNIEQKRLGDKYCHFVDVIDGHDRYAINISGCLELQEKYNQEAINHDRHNQLIRIAILVAILGVVIALGLSKIF